MINTLCVDENGTAYFASEDRRSIVRLNWATGAQTIEYTFDGAALINRLVCGGAGQFYATMSDNTVVGLRTGFVPFTSSQVESKKLLGFDVPIPLTQPIPIKGTPDFGLLGTWAQYDLEIRADGVYTAASSSPAIPGDARILFDGVFLLH